jgi:hypothetical protein
VLLVFRSAFELDANSSFLHTREDGHPDIAGYVGDFSVVSTVLKKAYPGVCTQKLTIPIILFLFLVSVHIQLGISSGHTSLANVECGIR